MIRVLVVDDHPVVRQGLSHLLSQAGMEVVGEAESGKQGLRLSTELQPDVVLWDLAMPGGGLSAIGELKTAVPGVKVLVLTALDDPLLSREVAQAGADGFLGKTCTPEELIQAVRACAQGTPFFPCLPELSPREEKVLDLLAEGLSNRLIAERLGISVKTVESYLENLKRKLGCASTAELRARALRRT